MAIKIISTEEYADNCEIVSVYGQGCNYETKKGLDGFQVDFDVEADNGAETKKFHIVYQSMERMDNMMAYNGFEMATATKYGCDADESVEMEDFMDYDEDIFDELRCTAEHLSKEHLNSLLD